MKNLANGLFVNIFCNFLHQYFQAENFTLFAMFQIVSYCDYDKGKFYNSILFFW